MNHKRSTSLQWNLPIKIAHQCNVWWLFNNISTIRNALYNFSFLENTLGWIFRSLQRGTVNINNIKMKKNIVTSKMQSHLFNNKTEGSVKVMYIVQNFSKVLLIMNQDFQTFSQCLVTDKHIELSSLSSFSRYLAYYWSTLIWNISTNTFFALLNFWIYGISFALFIFKLCSAQL